MLHEFSRMELLLGPDVVRSFSRKRIAIFGLGGVGSYVTEGLARCGIGNLDIIDNDTVALTNINRQLIALHSTIGRKKTDVVKERILDINPQAIVYDYDIFLGPDTMDLFPWECYDYVIDAIDTVSSKLLLIQKASDCHIPIISCMGVGNKLHPELLSITDLYKTTMCPLARVMRRECKARQISHCKVLYSREEPLSPLPEAQTEAKGTAGRPAPGSVSFVPSVAGLMIAGEVIRELAGEFQEKEEVKNGTLSGN